MCAAGYIVGTGGPRGVIAGVAAGNSARELLSSKSAGAQRRSSLFLEVRAAIAACGRRPLEIAANTQVIDFIGGHARNRTGVRRFAVCCVTTPPRGLTARACIMRRFGVAMAGDRPARPGTPPTLRRLAAATAGGSGLPVARPL